MRSLTALIIIANVVLARPCWSEVVYSATPRATSFDWRRALQAASAINRHGPLRSTAGLIAASGCRMIGGPLANCDAGCHSRRAELNAQSICDFFNSHLITDQIAGRRTTVGCQP